MPDPNIIDVGEVADVDGMNIDIVVDYNTVEIAGYRLDQAGCEQFAQLFVRAQWLAARCQPDT